MTPASQDVPLYGVTHGRMLPSLAEHGILCRRAVRAQGVDFQTISNEEIEELRSQTIVPCGPRGSLHEYVPFYFGPRSPMMYRISCRNLPSYDQGQRPLVYLVTSIIKVVEAGLRFVFSDGHPIMALTEFFDDTARLDAVDLPLMKQRYWNETAADPDRPRRRQAEFLVHQRVPWEVVTEIGVLDERVASRVEAVLRASRHRPAVVVRRSWYYDEQS